MIFALAWRNIWRQPIRTALSMVGMAFTSMLLVFMLSFQFGSYDVMKSSMLQISDGFGRFEQPGYIDDPELTDNIPDYGRLIDELAALPRITAVTARANGYGLLANGERSFAAAVLGIDPANEPKVSTMSSMISQGRALAPDDTAAITLGDGLARNLRLEIGDPVTLLGSGTDGSVAADVLTLVGIFKTNVPEIDRQIAQMPLARFDETFLMEGSANVVAITGARLLDIEGIESDLRRIASKYDVAYLNWAEIRPEVRQAITFDMSTALMMYSILVVVVVFIILNTLYMSVLERTREFGLLLSIGMRQQQLGRMIWMEMIFLSLLGTGIGIAIGMALTYYFQQVGIAIDGMDEIYAEWGLPSRFYPVMTPFRVLLGPGAIVISIALLGIIPYRRVLSLRPVTAMAT